jgi:hypothetical protein
MMANMTGDFWDFPDDLGDLPARVKALHRVVRCAEGGHPGAAVLLAWLLPDPERLRGEVEAMLEGRG